ncbi:unnamed protein product [Ixodes hexagonus]
MAAKPLVLRVKSQQGHFRLDTLTGESTVEELKACLFSLTGIPPPSLRVLADFPPRPLDCSDELRQLGSFPVRSGDTLIVEEQVTPIALREEHRERARVREGEAFETRERDHARVARSRRAVHVSSVQFASASTRTPLPVSEPGVLLRRSVPADNSCLFTSVYLALSGGDYDAAAGAALRQVIADAVAADRETYTEAFLGRPNREYCTWILNEDHWGGAIELAVLSRHYGLEMVAVDAQSARLHRFGEDQGYDQRILLLYDGIHYDPLVLEPLEPGRPPRTLFSAHDDTVLALALELAREAKASRQYTDVRNFTLRCLACDMGLVGQDQARKHAAETGHLGFGEV